MDQVSAIQNAAQRMADSPAPLIVATIAGLVLLLAGAKLLRVGVVLLGLAGGAAIGSVIAGRVLSEPIAQLPPVWVGGGIGALAGAFLGFALFRFAMAITSAGACAGVGVLAAALWLTQTHGPLPTFEPRIPEWREALIVPTSTAQPTDEETRRLLDQARTAGRDFSDDALAYWSSLPAFTQRTLALGALGGALLGLLVGSVAPRRAAALMTGLVGSGIAISCAVMLAERFAPHTVPQLGPQGWLIAWAVLGVAGCAAQLKAEKSGRTAKPAAA